MRLLLIILIFLFSNSVFAQKPSEESLKQSIKDVNLAFVKKDSNALKSLLNENLNYGHSNGWIQTKRDAINDLFNGKIVYNSIQNEEQSLSMENGIAWVRTVTNINVILDNKPMQFKLNVLQVWIWKKKHWELFARQSVKLS